MAHLERLYLGIASSRLKLSVVHNTLHFNTSGDSLISNFTSGFTCSSH